MSAELRPDRHGRQRSLIFLLRVQGSEIISSRFQQSKPWNLFTKLQNCIVVSSVASTPSPVLGLVQLVNKVKTFSTSSNTSASCFCFVLYCFCLFFLQLFSIRTIHNTSSCVSLIQGYSSLGLNDVSVFTDFSYFCVTVLDKRGVFLGRC